MRANIYHVNQLREFELDFDGEGVTDVGNGPHELVVVGQQVVVEALGVGVRRRGRCKQRAT